MIPVLVGLFFDSHFDGVIGSCERECIPLRILDLSIPIQPSTEDSEEEAYQDSAGRDHAQLPIFGALLGWAHHAAILDKQGVEHRLTGGCLTWPQVLHVEVQLILLLADGAVKTSLDGGVGWLAREVRFSVDTLLS